MQFKRRGRIVHAGYTEGCLRIVARLIQVDYVKHKGDYFPVKGAGVLEAYARLHNLFPELRPFFQYYARNVQYGYSLETLRDNPPEYTLRSIAKLKPRSSSRRG